MSFLDAIIIGFIQALTEFFPISSSAHLKIVKHLLGVDSVSGGIILDLSCHLGTLFSVLYFLRKEIKKILFFDRQKLLFLFAALIPLIPCYFLLKPLRERFSDPKYLGICLLCTALVLFAGQKLRLKVPQESSRTRQFKDVLCIGVMQSAALIPGISRSGSTIACARVLGWEIKDAVRFSFLLSIPTIIGGNSLELLKLAVIEKPSIPISFFLCFAAFFTSLIGGLIFVGFAFKILEKGHFKPFAWYCIGLGLFAMVYFNLSGA